MIYLRPSQQIKNTESTGNIVISESLLDEHLSHIAYFAGDKRPFALRIEASNGVVLDEHSTTATELSVRIYTREGVDVTEFIGSLKPSWQIGSEEIGKGLSYTVQASILKNWHTKIIVTTTAARILDAMGKLQSKTAEEQRLLERLTIDASIEVRRDFVLLQRIPTAELVRDSLKLDKEFIAATTGKQGAPGKDAAPIRPNLLKGYIDRVVTLEARNNGTSSDNYNYNWLVGPNWLEDGKAYVISADFEWVSGEKPDGVSLIMYKRDNNHLYSHLSLDGKTKARVSIYIQAGVHNTVGIAGYAGRAGKTRGVAARYNNIKLEEVQEGETKESTTYLPHTEDLKGAAGKDGKTPSVELKGNYLYIDGVKQLQSLQGPQGLQGVKGVDGTPGAPGKDGKTPSVELKGNYLYIDGVKQLQSLQGPQGLQGVKGVDGTPGAPGKDGKTPSVELKGNYLYIDGVKQLQSLQGPQGLQGVKGVDGTPGAPGKDGKTPSVELKGNYLYIDGVKQLQSLQGPQGLQGVKGVDGTPGAPGKDGKTPSVELKGNYLYIDGVKQLQSLQGPQGLQGVKGVDGTPGAPGKDGKTPSVELKGNYLYIDGVKQLQSLQGPQGLQGVKGVDGTPGAPGKDGKTPSVELKGNYLYIDGVKQLQSLQGPQGLQGVKGVDGTPGAPGKDGKTPSVELKGNYLYIDGVKQLQSLQGPQGLQGVKGVDGTPGAPGKDGKTPSVELKGNYLYIDGVKQLQSLQGPQGLQGVKGVDGTPGAPGKDGKDATPVRPNLWLSNVKIYPNMGHGADNVHVTYKGDGVYRVTKHDKMYVVVSMYSDKLQEDKTTKTIITSWRVVGASRQELLKEKYLKNKNGRYYITKNTEHKEVNVRGTLYAHPWRGDENHWIDGDWIEFADVKVELVEDGDILEPTAYIPNIPSLDYLSSSTAQKITQESIYLSRIQNGMARYDDLNQVRKIVEGHQVNWETLDDNYLRPIRQQQDDLRVKQNNSEQRLGDVEQDIIKFAYRAAGTSSSEWSDYTNNEYVGGGHKPDPWGGGGIDGYIRIVHNYEIYRAMNNIPSTHIEQSKKILRDKEYKIGDKYHRDASATIVYDIQTLDGIGRGQARHWRLFTTPHAASILRYGNRTKMGNPDMQGHQVGSYYNVVLDRGTTYDIYAHNDGGGKYNLYIAKNGAYK